MNHKISTDVGNVGSLVSDTYLISKKKHIKSDIC
jgi:hypothetical protein